MARPAVDDRVWDEWDDGPRANRDDECRDATPGDAHPEGGPGDRHDRHERDPFHARRGHRPGGPPSARSGGESDIVRPLLVAPEVASRIVADGAVLALPLPHLVVVGGDDRFLVWTVRVVAPHERPVPATLHLLGSPSMVVTVLELVPSRRLRWGRDRFVARGVEAMDVLARRIELAAA